VTGCPYLRDVLKIRGNKGLSIDEKIDHMQQKLKELNNYKTRLILSMPLRALNTMTQEELERLRQERDIIMGIIAKEERRKSDLANVLYGPNGEAMISQS
jgi:hypothetical protein